MCTQGQRGPEKSLKLALLWLYEMIYYELMKSHTAGIPWYSRRRLILIHSPWLALSLISERVQQRDSRRDLEGGSICHQKTVVHPGATRFFSPADHCALSLLQSLSLPPAFMFLLPHAEQKTFSFPFSGCFYYAWVKLRARVNRLEEKFRSPWMLRHYNNIVALSRN